MSAALFFLVACDHKMEDVTSVVALLIGVRICLLLPFHGSLYGLVEVQYPSDALAEGSLEVRSGLCRIEDVVKLLSYLLKAVSILFLMGSVVVADQGST